MYHLTPPPPHFFRTLIVLSSLLLTQGVSAFDFPPTGPSGSYSGGLFGTYFQNMTSNACPLGQAMYAYDSNPATFGKPLCRFTSSYWLSDNGGSSIYFIGTGSTGIGTNTPGAKLDVRRDNNSDGDALAFGSQTYVMGRLGEDVSTNKVYLSNTYNNDSSFIDFRLKGTGSANSKMIIQANGNVGIGVANPANVFQVDGSPSDNLLRFQNNSTTFNEMSMRLRAKDVSNNNTHIDIGIKATGGSDTGYFFVRAPYNGTEKLVVNTTGNVGIGTTSPGYKLDVNGTVNATAFRGDGSALTNIAATLLNPLSGDGNYKLGYTADGQRTNAGEWGRVVMRYVPNGQTYGVRVDRADYADSAGNSTTLGGYSEGLFFRSRGTVTGDVGTDSITGNGVYAVGMTGYSDLVANFGGVGGSTPSFQLRANYGDSLWFRASRDAETTWDGMTSRANRIYMDNYHPNADNSITLGGLALHAGRNNEANKVVRTDVNGYIQAGWLNTPSGNVGDWGNGTTKFYASGDDYVRYLDRNSAKVQLGLTSKWDADRRDYTTDSNYFVGSMGWGTTDLNSVFDWGAGFWDSWSSPGNSPGDTSHYVGINAVHYTNGSSRYGWQMAGGPTSRPWYRQTWGGFGGWQRILTDANDPYAYNMNQYLRTSDAPTFQDLYINGWFRNNNSGQGIYNQATGNHFYSDGNYWNVAYGGTTGIRLRNGHAGPILGYLYGETNGNFGLLHNGGGWAVQVYPGGGGFLHGNWYTSAPVSGSSIATKDYVDSAVAGAGGGGLKEMRLVTTTTNAFPSCPSGFTQLACERGNGDSISARQGKILPYISTTGLIFTSNFSGNPSSGMYLWTYAKSGADPLLSWQPLVSDGWYGTLYPWGFCYCIEN